MNSKFEFILSLNKCRVDVLKTTRFCDEFDCEDVFGTRYKCGSAEGLLSKLSQLGANVSGWKYIDGEFTKNALRQEEKEGTYDTVQEQQVTTDTQEVVAERNDVLDWDLLDSLENTQEDRQRLKDYATSIGYELKGNMKLPTMIEKLQKMVG